MLLWTKGLLVGFQVHLVPSTNANAIETQIREKRQTQHFGAPNQTVYESKFSIKLGVHSHR